MKTIIATFTAALIAMSSFAEGEIVVMDSAYYEHCKTEFYHQCWYLSSSVDAVYNAFSYNLGLIDTRLTDTKVSIANAATQILVAKNALDGQSDATPVVEARLDSALDTLSDTDASISRLQSDINTYIDQLDDDRITLKQEVFSVSNSFPLAIASTNYVLELYVMVSNNFEMASNGLCSCEHSYTNFLNYYRGIEDQFLDQYRATVTNLLDWSFLGSYVDYSRWTLGALLGSASDLHYYNFAFGAIPWNGTSRQLYFGGNPARVGTWSAYSTTLPAGYDVLDFLVFSVQGIHDSAEYGARAVLQVKDLFSVASTNFVMSLKVLNSQTNTMVQFLSAPKTYGEQVYKIASTMNYFQRIEHWLSAIARNTNNPDTDVSDSDESNLIDELQSHTNWYNQVSSSIEDQVVDTVNMHTNLFGRFETTFVTSARSCFNCFLIGSNRAAGGGSASQRFPVVHFMEMDWFGSRLRDLTDKPNTAPSYVTLTDYRDNRYDGWSILLRVVDICHDVFGIVWVLLGFGLCIFTCVNFSKFAIILWWRLIKFIPDVARFTLGG